MLPLLPPPQAVAVGSNTTKHTRLSSGTILLFLQGERERVVYAIRTRSECSGTRNDRARDRPHACYRATAACDLNRQSCSRDRAGNRAIGPFTINDDNRSRERVAGLSRNSPGVLSGVRLVYR